MERLTYDFSIGDNHCWQVKGADNLECREVCERQGDEGCKTCHIAKAVDRLAAYEETGMEPEDILRILDAYGRGMTLRTENAQRLEIVKGIQTDRLRELAEADREGRCVILPKDEPLKKGMTIWYVDTDTGEIEEGEVFSIDYKDGRLDSFSVDFKFSGDFDEFFGSAWGSCFFGSREQAQAALRREQDENR